jgi:hypothetical protein
MHCLPVAERLDAAAQVCAGARRRTRSVKQRAAIVTMGTMRNKLSGTTDGTRSRCRLQHVLPSRALLSAGFILLRVLTGG